MRTSEQRLAVRWAKRKERAEPESQESPGDSLGWSLKRLSVGTYMALRALACFYRNSEFARDMRPGASP